MNGLFNFGTFFKFLGRNKLYTLIDVFGLSVSLMFVILIGVYTTQELSTDRYHSKADRTYALGNDTHLGSAYRLAYRIQERYPEVEKVCPIANSETTVAIQDRRLKTDILFADSTFFDFFDFKLSATHPVQVLSARNYAVVSRSFARKAFGNEDPMGKAILIHDSLSVVVNGVMDDVKNSTIPYFDLLVRIDNVKYFNSNMDDEDFSNAGSAFIFIMEKEKARLQDKTDDMLAFFKEIFWPYKFGTWNKVQLIPLKQIYFSDINGLMLKQGDWKLVMILMSVGLAILLFAIANYVNLTVAQSGFRAKEMATRRLLGSSRQELFVRLMLESTLLCLLSFLLAVFLSFLCVPYADSLLETKINLPGALSVWSLLGAAGLILVLGAVSGWLPAMLISNVKPIDIVKGSFGKKNKMVFSRFFIVFQNVITIMLLAASITMTMQTNHLIHAPLGYNTDNIIDISTFSGDFKDKETMSFFANEVRQLASVKRVGFAQGTPFNGGNNNTTKYRDKSISFQILGGDTACFEMLGYKIIKDNHSGNAGNNHAYFSRQAMKETELPDDAAEFRVNENRTMVIDGIIEDVQVRNITHDLQPVQFFFSTLETSYPWDILIETQGDPATAFEQVKQVFERVTRTNFSGQYMTDQIRESFSAQQRTSRIVILFTAIAVLISLLGLLATSTYFIRQRTKEIAIRKVYGAENFRMLSQLVLTFLAHVAVAFVIAVPLIGYIMNRWLSDYSYRINMSPWIFVAAGAFCLLVSFVSVYWQSRRAAHANPVQSLQSE
jgi:putative ABC transport system permease protein